MYQRLQLEELQQAVLLEEKSKEVGLELFGELRLRIEASRKVVKEHVEAREVQPLVESAEKCKADTAQAQKPPERPQQLEQFRRRASGTAQAPQEKAKQQGHRVKEAAIRALPE